MTYHGSQHRPPKSLAQRSTFLSPVAQVTRDIGLSQRRKAPKSISCEEHFGMFHMLPRVHYRTGCCPILAPYENGTYPILVYLDKRSNTSKIITATSVHSKPKMENRCSWPNAVSCAYDLHRAAAHQTNNLSGTKIKRRQFSSNSSLELTATTTSHTPQGGRPRHSYDGLLKIISEHQLL